MRCVYLLTGLLLVGCASSGNESVRDVSDTSVAAHVTKGQTTKDQVRASYGDPTAIGFTDSGNEQWTYVHAVATAKAVNFVPIIGMFAGGADVAKSTFVIFFDKTGVVQNYSVSKSQSEVRRGIGSM